jgi:hypothetical protein
MVKGSRVERVSNDNACCSPSLIYVPLIMVVEGFRTVNRTSSSFTVLVRYRQYLSLQESENYG